MRPLTPPLQISVIDSCESTNQQLLINAEQGAPAGCVLVAREQTAGKGRRGRSWLAEPGKTLTFSLLWTFPADASRLNGLSLAVGVGVMRALKHPELGAMKTHVLPGLKWPNDVLLRCADKPDAKMGGILIESVVRQSPKRERELAVVIGVGLNCLPTESTEHRVTDQPAASLAEAFVSDKALAPEQLLPYILEALSRTLVEFSSQGFQALRHEWEALHLWNQEPVRICESGKVLLEGIVRGVDADGALCIATPSGIERIITGDVSLRKV